MFGTILGSMVWFLVFFVAWLSLGWVGIALVGGGVGFAALSINSMLNDMEK